MRRFTSEKLEPLALQIDRTGEVPQGAVDLLREQGYLGMRLPSEYGGGDPDLPTYCLALEEFARSHRCTRILLDATSASIRLPSRATAATHRRKGTSPASPTARSAPPSASPSPARAPARPAASRSMKTRAEKRDGGITAFLVEKGTPGST